MPRLLQRNALIVVALAALFCWSFLFAKHDPALRTIIPFSDDPYDAVGSFGVIVGTLVALLSLVRAFRPYREVPSAEQRGYLVRSQEAVVLIVFITLVTDAVAMARHPSTWIGVVSRFRLIALLGVLAIVTGAVQVLIRASEEKLGGLGTTRWVPPVSITLLAMLALAAYPEYLINHTATHLFTVLVGDIALFAPIRYLLNAMVPYPLEGGPMTKRAKHGALSTGQRWAIALLAGTLIGLFAFLAEISEGNSPPPWGRMAIVGSVYTFLGAGGILIAYAFLAEPLGLGPRGAPSACDNS